MHFGLVHRRIWTGRVFRCFFNELQASMHDAQPGNARRKKWYQTCAVAKSHLVFCSTFSYIYFTVTLPRATFIIPCCSHPHPNPNSCNSAAQLSFAMKWIIHPATHSGTKWKRIFKASSDLGLVKVSILSWISLNYLWVRLYQLQSEAAVRHCVQF